MGMMTSRTASLEALSDTARLTGKPSRPSRSIAGTSPTDVWAVTLQGTVLRYNGQSFAIVSRDELPRLHAIVSKGGHLYLSGALGTILHRSPTE